MGSLDKLIIATLESGKSDKHPKCKGFKEWTDCGYEYDCGYATTLDCDQCKYGLGRKDPEAKCNMESDYVG